MKIDVLANKEIADGNVTLITWFDEGVTDKQLYQVEVISSARKRLTILLPPRVEDGTEERAWAIFNGLNEKTTCEDLQAEVAQEKGIKTRSDVRGLGLGLHSKAS